jgi:hypothetical protein
VNRRGLIPVVLKIVSLKTVAIRYVLGVRLFFFVQLDGVEPDNDEARPTLIAGDDVALLRFGIDEYFFGAFGADRCWHFS